MRSGKYGICKMRECNYIFPGIEDVMKFCIELQISIDLIIFKYLINVNIDNITFSSFKQFDIVLWNIICCDKYYHFLVNEMFREFVDIDVDLKE